MSVAIGFEQGNLGDAAAPPGNGWVRVSSTPTNDDIPGANLFMRHHTDVPQEVLLGWWTTTHYAGPAREPVGATQMLFSEQNYRSAAVLTRFVAEQYSVPRNFLLFPHAQRADTITSAAVFGRLVNADPATASLINRFTALHVQALDFANAAQLNTNYTTHNNITTHVVHHATVPLRNEVWDAYFRTYRGVHGHAASGDTLGLTTTALAPCSTGIGSPARCGTGGGTRSTSSPWSRPRP